MSSKTFDWKGGRANFKVDGPFVTRAGVSTLATLSLEQRQADGSLGRGQVLREVREPGVVTFYVPEGRVTLHAHLPDGAADIEMRLEEFVQPPKPLTREQELEARVAGAVTPASA